MRAGRAPPTDLGCSVWVTGLLDSTGPQPPLCCCFLFVSQASLLFNYALRERGFFTCGFGKGIIQISALVVSELFQIKAKSDTDQAEGSLGVGWALGREVSGFRGG